MNNFDIAVVLTHCSNKQVQIDYCERDKKTLENTNPHIVSGKDKFSFTDDDKNALLLFNQGADEITTAI